MFGHKRYKGLKEMALTDLNGNSRPSAFSVVHLALIRGLFRHFPHSF